jgi:hypothetical protein
MFSYRSPILSDVVPLSDAMEEQGILVNPHTPDNIFTLTAVWQALGKVYQASGGHTTLACA